MINSIKTNPRAKKTKGTKGIEGPVEIFDFKGPVEIEDFKGFSKAKSIGVKTINPETPIVKPKPKQKSKKASSISNENKNYLNDLTKGII